MNQVRTRKLISFLGLFSAGAFCVCLFSVLGFFGKWYWAFDASSHFRVQYAVILIFVSLLFFLKKAPNRAAIFLSFGVLNAALIFPLFSGGAVTPTEDGFRLRAMHLNVLASNHNYEQIFSAIEDVDPDILLLQEMTPELTWYLGGKLTNYSFRVEVPRSDCFGMAFYSKIEPKNHLVEYWGKVEIPSVVAEYEDFIFVGTHPVPPMAHYFYFRNDQLDAVANYVAEQQKELLLMGDLNVSPWSYWFNRFVKRSGLVDSERGFGVQPTWFGIGPWVAIPIDHALHTDGIVISNRQVCASVGSDHRPLIIDFCVDSHVVLEKGE